MSKYLFYIPSLMGGGAERVMVNLASHYAEEDLDITFVVNNCFNAVYSLPKNVKLISLNVTSSFAAILPLRRVLRQIAPSYMLSALTWGNIVAITANKSAGINIRHTISEHCSLAALQVDGSTNKKRGFLWGVITRFLIGILYPFASGGVAVSNGIKMDFEAAYPRTIGMWSVISNPVYVERPSDMGVVELPFIGKGKFILGVGRLAEQKSFDVLINSFAEISMSVPDYSLVILGDGPLREELAALIEFHNLSKRIFLTGFTERVYEFYNQAEVFVLSSKAEGFGNVLVEALSFGLKVVATDCPHGPSEVLDGGKYGQLVAVGDVKEMAKKIRIAINADRCSERSLARAREFSVQVIGEKYRATLNGLTRAT